MDHTFETEMTISIGSGSETTLDLVITYSAHPGSPEVGRGYMADPAKYDPGSGDELEIAGIHLKLRGRDVVLPRWLEEAIEGDGVLNDAIVAEWRERFADTGPDPDDARDRRIDDEMAERGR